MDLRTDIRELDFIVRILIVENDTYFQHFLGKVINRLGFHFILAEDGSSAQQLLNEQDISVVILNIQTPGVDGLDLVNRISVFKPNTDVIVLMTDVERISLTEVINSGAVDFLIKPFTLDEARAKLSRLVRERKLIHELVVENRKRLETEAELRNSHELLEKRVRERTVQLERAKAKAEQANAAQSEFMANISHELRTPMHGILSFARLGANKIDRVNKERLKGYFQEIEKSGNRLLKLLNNLLDLSKMEADMMQYSVTTCDLGFLVNQVVQNFSALAEENKLCIFIEKRTQDVTCKVDEERFLQVMTNLLNNAVKYSTQGATILVEILEKSDTHLQLNISDEGIGIPENELQIVFDKFTQSSKTRSGAGGTGLGLAICKKIISDHGGEIWAENRPKGGAIFCLTLPR